MPCVCEQERYKALFFCGNLYKIESCYLVATGEHELRATTNRNIKDL